MKNRKTVILWQLLRKLGSARLPSCEVWTAVGTIGLFAIAVWIPFFSQIPHRIAVIAHLSHENAHLIAESVQSQTQALQALHAITNSAVEAEHAQTAATNALLASRTAEHQVSRLSVRKKALTARVLHLRTQSKLLALRNARANNSLEKAKATVRRLVNASISLMYASAFQQFSEQMTSGSPLYIPVRRRSPYTANGNKSTAKGLEIIFVDTRAIHLSTKSSVRHNGYKIGPYIIYGIEQTMESSSDRGISIYGKVIPKTDSRLRKFVEVLKSRSPALLLSSDGLPIPGGVDNPYPNMLDVLERMIGGEPRFAVVFVPGTIGGDYSFEDWWIRDFWIRHVGSVLDRTGRISNKLKSLLSKPVRRITASSTSFSINISKPKWKSFLQSVRDTFGTTAFSYLQKRLSVLQNSWVRQLSAGNVYFRYDKPLRLVGNKNLTKLFYRWNWGASTQKLSAMFVTTISREERAEYVITCSAARFLDIHRLSDGPRVLTAIRACKEVGIGGFPGEHVGAFIEFTMPGGRPFPFPCAKIDAKVTGYSFSFHPSSVYFSTPRPLCAFYVLVPEGAPITVTASYQGYVGKPAVKAPLWMHTKSGSAEIGWNNPTRFRITGNDNDNSRLIEMVPQSSIGAH